ncbi:polysaccharide deacetylase [Clostridium polyendosporum]|uniref:Polysaccharide deacetylase n=1 Tax=Clostridium polyendosporum TaxID=69208 RepID=A0A919S1E9_9CLOT|nr:polysaccharide deacetylase family protein [Clostridium polyendosporum]GIM30485.1 polysaccharide deacetylase [Clostridium polyendosporum]
MRRKIILVPLILIILRFEIINFKAFGYEETGNTGIEKKNSVVFLTFDDGPSYTNTLKILDILKNYNVNATFFVVGNNAGIYPEIIKQMKECRMAICPHCYNHNYRVVYESEEAYSSDLNKCIEVVGRIIGNINSNFIRLPGGSLNSICNTNILSKIKINLLQNNISYVDWNVNAGDAASAQVNKDAILSNIYNGGDYYRIAVVLLHDAESKTTTVEALPLIIEYYKSRGYIFKSFDEMTKDEYEYLINAKVINKK